MKIQSSKIEPKIAGKVFGKILSDKVSPWLYSSAGLPPVADKLIAWLKGPNTSTVLKKEYVSKYDFTIQNCTPDYFLDGNNEQILDGVGDPLWAELLYTGWDCEYLAPASGSAGYTELLAIDDGTLYTTGTPDVLSRAVLEAISNDQMFFCKNPGKGFAIYSEVLTSTELSSVESYFSCYENTIDSTDMTMDTITLTMDNEA